MSDRRRIGAFVLAMALMASAGASPAQATRSSSAGGLTYRPVKGQRFVVATWTVSSSTIEDLAEQKAKRDASLSRSGESWEVSEVAADGAFEVKIWSTPTESLSYLNGRPKMPSQQPSTNDLMAAIFRKYPRVVAFTARGEVLKVSGLEEPMEEYRTKIEQLTDDRRVRASIDELMEITYGEDNVRRLVQDLIIAYPPQPLRRGTTWKERPELAMGKARMSVTQQFKLLDDPAAGKPFTTGMTGVGTISVGDKNVELDVKRLEMTARRLHDANTRLPILRTETSQLDYLGKSVCEGNSIPCIRVAMIARSHSTVIDYQPSIHAEKARSLSSARQYAQAIEEVTKAIELQPMCPVLYQNRGVIRQEANDDVGAIADLTKALDLDDECDDAIHARAYSRFRRGDKDGAVKDYTELIKRRGDMPQPYFLRAWVLSEAKEYAKAVADYSATIERDVEYAPAYRGRWAAYRALGNETAAQADAAMYEKLRGR